LAPPATSTGPIGRIPALAHHAFQPVLLAPPALPARQIVGRSALAHVKRHVLRPISLVSAILGHADLKTISVYAHARCRKLRARRPELSSQRMQSIARTLAFCHKGRDCRAKCCYEIRGKKCPVSQCHGVGTDACMRLDLTILKRFRCRNAKMA